MLAENKNCGDCGKLFQSQLIRSSWIARCPECADKHQRRPSLVIDRIQIFESLCVINSLPGDWEPFQSTPKDSPCWRIILKGEKFGAAWDGRIDIYCQNVVPPQSGTVVRLEEIEAIHKLKAVEERRERLSYSNGIRINYPVTQRLPINSEKGEEIIDRHNYVRLSSVGMIDVDQETLPKLVWRSCYSKTTFKGLGRQYKYELVGSPIWQKSLSGGVRSGRAYTSAALALIDEQHPLEVKEIFN